MFPLLRVEGVATKLPPEIVAQGGYIMPMHPREALWLSFKSSDSLALKVSVGAINAITGLPKTQPPPVDVQDYLCSKQPWLDGIATKPGIVRQFVAVDVGDGYSVEEQITGQVGRPSVRHEPDLSSLLQHTATLQFDVFGRHPLAQKLYSKYYNMRMDTTPAAINKKAGSTIDLTPS